MSPAARRAVVTGLGAVCAFGWGIDPLWHGLAAGRAAFGPIRRFDASRHRTQLAAEVPPPPYDVVSALALDRRVSLADLFGLAAAREALAEAGLGRSLAGARAGLYFGSSTGGFFEAERQYAALAGETRAPFSVGPFAPQQCNAPGEAVARQFAVEGPVETFSSACASATLALGAALDALRDGAVDVAVVGGADCFCQLTHGGFNSLRSVDPEPCRPFRTGRAGLNIGEGGAVLVLEERERALARGAQLFGELLGCGASCDAGHMTAPDADGAGPAAAIEAALADAGVRPDEIRFVNAHGTGTPLNDAAEAAALRSVFGEGAAALPVTSSKGAIGHLLGAAGAIEAAATVLCLIHGQVHPTPGAGEVDPDAAVRLVVGGPLGIAPGPALSINLAFGGANAAAVFGPAPIERGGAPARAANGGEEAAGLLGAPEHGGAFPGERR